MKQINSIQIDRISKEEMLPDFSPEFPYIASRAELDRYLTATMGTPWHWHRTVELFYVESGCVEYTTPHGCWSFPAGSGGMINANVLHTSGVHPKDGPNVQLLHLFDPVLLAGSEGSRLQETYIRPLTASPLEMLPLFPDDPEQAEILHRIRLAFDIDDQAWGYEFRLREALTDIWLRLFRLAAPTGTDPFRQTRADSQIKALMAYVHEHYAQPISVDSLAASIHVSRRVCFRLFRDNLHMTPLEYIREYRLRQACRLLETGDASITEIASRCGLGSSSYFGKTFRDRFDCTPAQYRRNWHDRDIKHHDSDSF